MKIWAHPDLIRETNFPEQMSCLTKSKYSNHSRNLSNIKNVSAENILVYFTILKILLKYFNTHKKTYFNA